MLGKLMNSVMGHNTGGGRGRNPSQSILSGSLAFCLKSVNQTGTEEWPLQPQEYTSSCNAVACPRTGSDVQSGLPVTNQSTTIETVGF